MPRITAEGDMPADVRAVLEQLTKRYGSLPSNHAVLARRPAIFPRSAECGKGWKQVGCFPRAW
jgi:hypothetical protein